MLLNASPGRQLRLQAERGDGLGGAQHTRTPACCVPGGASRRCSTARLVPGDVLAAGAPQQEQILPCEPLPRCEPSSVVGGSAIPDRDRLGVRAVLWSRLGVTACLGGFTPALPSGAEPQAPLSWALTCVAFPGAQRGRGEQRWSRCCSSPWRSWCCSPGCGAELRGLRAGRR